MTGREHYREAEKLTALAMVSKKPKWAIGYLAAAQVHAMLAVAAVLDPQIADAAAASDRVDGPVTQS